MIFANSRCEVDADGLELEPFLRFDVGVQRGGGFRIEVRVIENVLVQAEFLQAKPLLRPGILQRSSTRIRRPIAERLKKRHEAPR